jgi:hypothetical protein
MASRVLALCFVLGIASIANATANIELVPSSPGPFLGGETINVDVIINNGTPTARDLRLLQLDVQASDPALGLNGPFAFNLPLGGLGYAAFGAYPVPSAAYLGLSPQPGVIFNLPASGEATAGTISLTLPNAPGAYTLDVLNPTNTDLNEGALLNFGFGGADPATNWRGDGLGDALLTGGQTTFEVGVIPEPATLSLLALGGLAAFRRRRKA